MGKPGAFTEKDIEIVMNHVCPQAQSRLLALDAFIKSKAGPGSLKEEDAKLLKWIVSEEECKRYYRKDAIYKHLQSELGVFVKAEDIRKQHQGSYQLIKAKAKLINPHFAFNGILEVDSYVAFGNWKKLPLQGESINILDHLPLLLPKNQRCIGVFTFQNGIQNTAEDDFKLMGERIIENLKPEKPLCIGIYNPTNGVPYKIHQDLWRFKDEWDLNHLSLIMLRQMIVTFAKRMPLINPKMYWAHFAHSEGGLVANEVLTSSQFSFTSTEKQYFKNHMITATYGAVAPIPDKVLKATNTYSADDVTMFFASKYLDKLPKPSTLDEEELRRYYSGISKHPALKSQSELLFKQFKAGIDTHYFTEYPHVSNKNGYTLKIVESLVPRLKLVLLPQGDHAFNGETYQEALSKDIKKYRDEEFKIYDTRYMS